MARSHPIPQPGPGLCRTALDLARTLLFHRDVLTTGLSSWAGRCRNASPRDCAKYHQSAAMPATVCQGPGTQDSALLRIQEGQYPAFGTLKPWRCGLSWAGHLMCWQSLSDYLIRHRMHHRASALRTVPTHSKIPSLQRQLQSIQLLARDSVKGKGALQQQCREPEHSKKKVVPTAVRNTTLACMDAKVSSRALQGT